MRQGDLFMKRWGMPLDHRQIERPTNRRSTAKRIDKKTRQTSVSTRF
jgi:hypothetical protein